MNKVYKVIIAGTIFSVFGLFSGCTSTTLVDVWHDPSYQNAKMASMLVVAVRNNPVHRRMWEDAFVDALAKQGVAATPSYRLFPDALPDTDQMAATMQSNKFEGILVNRRFPTEKYTDSVPAYSTTEQEIHYSPFKNRYRTYYQEVEHPGYIDSQRVAVQEITVSTTREGGQLIWSAQSRTIDPSSREALQHEIIDRVMPELTRQGIIPSRR